MSFRVNSFEIELESCSPIVIRVRGEVDFANAKEVRGEIVRHLGDERDLTVLAREIGYMDSSGLRLLLDLHRECRRRGGKLTLVAPAPRLNRVLQITGLAAVLSIAPALQTLPVPA